VEYNNLANGISGDFGIGAGFITNTDLRVTSVEKASPAGLAGVRRGWQIIKVNGSSNVSTSNADLDVLNNAIFNSAMTTFTFKKPDGTTVDITLKTASYQTHPVVLDSVYTINGKAIGYLNFSSYLGDTTEIYSEFNRVFNRFTTAAIGDIIVDLRYNGGGYVSVAEKLSDYLAPSSANGNIMMIQKFNDKLSRYNKTTYFKKLGSLNLPRVFFIVSKSTASASELVINNLKPFMDVKLVGDSTFGKPVGFFPITIGEWDILPVSFKTVNKNGEGNYFRGFAPDAKVSDGIDKDFGDITENRLASAIKFITSGAFRYQSGTPYQESPQVLNGNALFDEHSFKGTISTPRAFK
jgi:C-terminal processing protease CtpA/Prc